MPRVPWFRFYTETRHDPKVLRLSDREYRVWVNLLTIAAENDGRICIDDLAIELRMAEPRVRPVLESLIAKGLIEQLEFGWCGPHNWNGRQYQSDVSTERVKRFRDRSMKRFTDVSETPPDTDTETDTEQMQKTETDAEQNRADADARAIENPPEYPFSFTYAVEWQRRHPGRRVPTTEHAAALAIERAFGADACLQLARDLDWQKHPNYMRSILEDPRNAKRQSANGQHPNASSPFAKFGT